MGSPQASGPVNNINGSSPDNKVSESSPPANKVISVHTLGIKFLNGKSQNSTPRLQNVFITSLITKKKIIIQQTIDLPCN